MAKVVKILFIGDIIGRPGRDAFREVLPGLSERYAPDVVIANGENSAGGFGITPAIYEELLDIGVDVVTSGNHIWDKREILGVIDEAERLIRPANYPKDTPGRGATLIETDAGVKVGVVNLSGTAFMESLASPFAMGKELVEGLRKKTPVILVDMHAETTSEKNAMAWHLDGLASVVVGTHTHVQTSDERILPGGTAFITDAGMTGPIDSVIGVKKELVLKRFLTGMPVRFEVAEDDVEVQGVFVEVDAVSGKATSIERIREKVS